MIEGKKVDVATVAKRLSCSSEHVKRLLEAGELEGVCIGVKPNTGKRVYWESVIKFEKRRQIAA